MHEFVVIDVSVNVSHFQKKAVSDPKYPSNNLDLTYVSLILTL